MIRIIVLATLLAACDETAPDGSGLVVEIRDQPATPDFGVLLAIHARGGNSVSVSVEAGALFVAGSEAANPVATSACILNLEGTSTFTTELAVIPEHDAALFSATLHAIDDCSDSGLQSRLLVVQKPTVADVVDAGIEDAP